MNASEYALLLQKKIENKEKLLYHKSQKSGTPLRSRKHVATLWDTREIAKFELFAINNIYNCTTIHFINVQDEHNTTFEIFFLKSFALKRNLGTAYKMNSSPEISQSFIDLFIFSIILLSVAIRSFTDKTNAEV